MDAALIAGLQNKNYVPRAYRDNLPTICVLVVQFDCGGVGSGDEEEKQKPGRTAGVKNKGLRRESSLCPQFENQCALAVAKDF